MLVADDLRINRTLIEHILIENDYEVVCVDNGAEAVNAVRTLAFDLVFMDLNMPVMDGGEAVAAIRALPKPLGNVPIIAMSAEYPSSIDEGRKALGMNGVLSKPFKVEELLRIAEEWCGKAFQQPT